MWVREPTPRPPTGTDGRRCTWPRGEGTRRGRGCWWVQEPTPRLPMGTGGRRCTGPRGRARGGGAAAGGSGSRYLGRRWVRVDAAAQGLAGRARGGGAAAGGNGSRRLGRRPEWVHAAAHCLERRARSGGAAAVGSRRLGRRRERANAAAHGLEGTRRWLVGTCRIVAQAKARDAEARTPLHLAVLEGHQGTVRPLLDHGADVKAQMAEGATTLRLAVLWIPISRWSPTAGKGWCRLWCQGPGRGRETGQFEVVMMFITAPGGIRTRSTEPTARTRDKAIVETILAEFLDTIAVDEFQWMKDLVDTGGP